MSQTNYASSKKHVITAISGIFSFHQRGTKKKSESPTGIEPMTSRTPVGRSND